jgi:glutamate 5-kinase
VPLVTDLDAGIEAMAGGANASAGVGTGGMATKIMAARIARQAGCATLITLGGRSSPLAQVEAGARATLVTAAVSPHAARKSWIGGSLAPSGVIRIDAGAARALRGGKSLLAAGVTAVEGRFGKGDAVVIRDEDGLEVGRGLCRYDSEDAARICGLSSAAIEATLGYSEGPVVHADDLAVGT